MNPLTVCATKLAMERWWHVITLMYVNMFFIYLPLKLLLFALPNFDLMELVAHFISVR